MQQRPLGRTGRDVSAIGLGTWQLGADWGRCQRGGRARGARGIRRSRRHPLRHGRRLRRRAQRVAHRRASSPSRPAHGITVATKMGRRVAQEPENYTPENFRAWTDRSRAQPRRRHARSRAAALPADGGDRGCRHLRRARCSRRRRVDRGLRRVGRDVRAGARRRSRGRTSTNVQIIFNPFRLKPLDEVLPAAEAAGVAIFARVPLASGLLSGRYTADDDVRRERPPHLQPPRRGVRPRRDVLGRGLRGRARGGARARRGPARGRLAAGGDARVGRFAPRRHQRHPRRAQRRAGGIERGCRGPARRGGGGPSVRGPRVRRRRLRPARRSPMSCAMCTTGACGPTSTRSGERRASVRVSARAPA